MREIKFRAWLPEFSRMIEHDEIDLTAGEVFERVYYPDTGFMNAFKRKGAKLMQFTGLHDRNGVPIYEGDIVKGKAFEFHRAPRIIGEVIYDYCEFKVKCVRDEHTMKTELNTVYEVIGNRWQHPHLLEQPNE